MAEWLRGAMLLRKQGKNTPCCSNTGICVQGSLGDAGGKVVVFFRVFVCLKACL